MNEETIGMIIGVCVMTIWGVILVSSYRFASWSINGTRNGHRWARWFGEERAISILRFVVGPFILLMSAVATWALLSGKITK